jgi:hypothetical protein
MLASVNNAIMGLLFCPDFGQGGFALLLGQSAARQQRARKAVFGG